MNDWREGARRGDPADVCPLCGKPGVLRWDFKKFGNHSFAYCESCKVVCVDGKRAADVKEGT